MRDGSDSNLAQPDFRSTVPCRYCGETIAWKQLSAHMKAVHPEVVAAGDHWAKDTKRVWIRAAIPAVLAWIASFVLIAVTPMSSYLIPIEIDIGAGWFVFIGTYFYARHATRGDFEEIRELPHFCRTCDEAVPGLYLTTHVREAHPGVMRLQRLTDAYMLLSAAIVVVLLGYFVALLLAAGATFTGGSGGRGIAGFGMLGWFGLVGLWMRFVYSPRMREARRRWEANHPGSGATSTRS